jgi:hypothetical protein
LVLRCGAPAEAAPQGSPAGGETRPVWLVSNGFHSSIGFRARDFSNAAAITGDPRATHVLLGWGDADFYRFNVTPWIFVKAVFWPTDGALHVVPVRGPIEQKLRNSDVVRFDLRRRDSQKWSGWCRGLLRETAPGGFVRLGRAISRRAASIWGASSFTFRRCATMWVANLLRKGGVKVIVPGAVNAGSLVWQTEPQGVRLGKRRKPLDAF